MTDLVLYITKEESFEEINIMRDDDFTFYIHSNISIVKVPILSSGKKMSSLVRPPVSSGVMYAEVIKYYVEKILKNMKFSDHPSVTFKVFFGTDYKTYGDLKTDTKKLPRKMRHEVPMEPDEVEYFRYLMYWTTL